MLSPTPWPSKRAPCSRRNGVNRADGSPPSKPTPLSQTCRHTAPSCGSALISTRASRRSLLNLAALPIRLTRITRSRSGSASTAGSSRTRNCGAPPLRPWRTCSITSRVIGPGSSVLRCIGASPTRASSSSVVTSRSEASACCMMIGSARRARLSSPSAQASRARPASPALPPSGPRRSCDTLRLKLSRPVTMLCRSAVRWATATSSEALLAASSASACERSAISACSARRRLSRLTEGRIRPTNAAGSTAQ